MFDKVLKALSLKQKLIKIEKEIEKK